MTGYDASTPKRSAEVLEALLRKLALGSPLSDFLTPQLLNWVGNRIYARKSPDIYAEYRSWEKLYEERIQQLSTANARNAEQERANAHLWESNVRLVAKNKILEDQVIQLEGELSRLRERYGENVANETDEENA